MASPRSSPRISNGPQRQQFKPTRPSRLSLSTLPTEPTPNKENAASTSDKRKKRAHSLGGEALEAARKKIRGDVTAELSPGKQRRRSLVPRRSILKATPAIFDGPESSSGNFDFAHTTDLSSLSTAPFNNRRRSSLRSAGQPNLDNADSQQDQEESSDSSSDGEMDMDLATINMTRNMDDRRKSMANRRVSFAPNAHIRTFTPDKPTAQAQALQQQQAAASAAAAAAALLSSPTSSDEGTSFVSNEEASFVSNEDVTASEASMEMASDNVTRTFGKHFAGTVPDSVYAEDEQDEEEVEGQGLNPGEEDQESEDGSDPDDDQTMDMDATNVYGEGIVASGPSRPPRPSEVIRQQDAEDEEALREIGLAKAGKRRESRRSRASVAFVGAGPVALDDASGADESMQDASIDEDADTEDESDKTMPMEMTTALGGVVKSVGNVVQKVRQSVGFGPGVGGESEDEEVGSGSDADADGETMDMSMAEKTGEIPAAVDDMAEDDTTEINPNNEVEATQTMDFTRAHGSVALGPGVPTPSTPSARLQADLFRRQSLAGAIAGPSPARNSPRRSVIIPSAQPPIVSTVPKSPRAVTLSPKKEPGAAGKRTPSPTKKTLSATGTPSQFVPKTLAGRSPGGSLSLRGLLQEQQTKSPFAPPSSLASPNVKGKGVAFGMSSPARQSPGRLSRVAEMKDRIEEEDNTESSFGYVEEGHEPAPISSFDAFFDATGTDFMKDILRMTGADLSKKRRKTMNFDRQPSGPPSFADLAVAGACKSLFHELYKSDQLRLQDDIHSSLQQMAAADESLQYEQPQIFSEWSNATEQHRAIMQSQFRKIKAYYYLTGRADWNTYRTENYETIIAVMEENLEALRLDNAVVAEATFDEVIPDLEARHAALLEELNEERQRDVELSACDPEELQELNAAIEEQKEQITMRERDRTEVVNQLRELVAKDQELAKTESDLTQETGALKNKLEEGRSFTTAEMHRLRDEYHALQHLHGWQLVSFTSKAVKLCHLNEFEVTLQLDGPNVYSTTFTPSQSMYEEGLLGEVTRFLFGKMMSNIEWVLSDEKSLEEGQSRHPRAILNRITSLWTSVRRLRQELTLANRRFPVTVQHSEDALHVIAEVHVPSKRASFVIIFELTGEEIATGEDDRGPVELEHVVANVGSEVRTLFGRIDVETLKYVVRERLDCGGRRAFVEACNEAEARCQEA